VGAAERDEATQPGRVARGEQESVHRSEGGAGRDGRIRQRRQHLVQQVALVLEVTLQALARRPLAGVPGLGVDAVQAPDLEAPRLDPVLQCCDEPEVLPLVEASLRGGEGQQRSARRPEVEVLDLPAERGAVPAGVVALHAGNFKDSASGSYYY